MLLNGDVDPSVEPLKRSLLASSQVLLDGNLDPFVKPFKLYLRDSSQVSLNDHLDSSVEPLKRSLRDSSQVVLNCDLYPSVESLKRSLCDFSQVLALSAEQVRYAEAMPFWSTVGCFSAAWPAALRAVINGLKIQYAKVDYNINTQKNNGVNPPFDYSAMALQR
ncbi:hypothetical protein QAD02_008660 [Eretmocerus hayati]|uniref:Uncharacterized protein n=1 Tax=Eretmocerus hayati TaxID=131215 RepID=A0ACC2N789_9HYME|nr:hypothetical protein QAD02_008660 [Eretmocerus hayati]